MTCGALGYAWMRGGVAGRGPCQGPKLGSCLTLGNEVSEETHAAKARDFIGKGRPGGEQEVREPRRAALPRGSQSRVLRWWDESPGGLWPIILTQSLSWWPTHRSAKMDASERDSGKWTDRRCLLLTFPDLFRLVVVTTSVFLIRISCPKTAHAHGY